MAARQTSDPRLTLTPEGSELTIEPEGFSLDCDGETFFRLRWDQVRQISAYTRFRARRPELCLAFWFSRRQKDQVVIHQGVAGWSPLCSAVLAAFPTADADWRAKASHDDKTLDAYAAVAATMPVFTVNPTIVWSK